MSDAPASRPRERLSAGLARRIAVTAAGLREPRPDRVTPRHVARVVERLGLSQIDSVNVLARAHYVPFFSRLGSYDPALLDRAAFRGRARTLFEYWAHEASLVRVDLHPLLRWRMEEARAGLGIYGNLARFASERRPFIDAVLRRVEREGPSTAGDLEAGPRHVPPERASGWWSWGDTKRALEWLFWAGLLTTRTRRNFARVYDLPERVLPPEVLAQPTPEPAEAHRGLIRVAARALGVATEPDLRDYFRLDPGPSKAAVATLCEAGELLPVSVEGWDAQAYLQPDAALPRRVEAQALVSPFDPLVWRRERAERIFGFRYRIGIYTPAHLRTHGYYPLPFVLGDRIVARVDLKADRATSRLLVQSLHHEARSAATEVEAALADEMAEMARWLGLGEVIHAGADRALGRTGGELPSGLGEAYR